MYINAINECKQSSNFPSSRVNPSPSLLSSPLSYFPEPPPYHHASPPNPHINLSSCSYHRCHNRSRKSRKLQTPTTPTATVPMIHPMTVIPPDDQHVSDCDVKKCRCFVGLNYCKLSVVFIFVLFISFSLLMFSGEKYTLYVRDNQVWSLISSFIFLYFREVVRKTCNCRKSHYLMIILLLSGDIERHPGPDSWTTIKHPNFCNYLRVCIYKIFLGEK